MADLNKVMLIGRCTRDPQLRYLPNKTPVCDVGFAVGRKWKDANGEKKEESTFIDCTIFGKAAEVFNQYMTKGKPAYLEGRLKLDQWDDKTTGQKRSKLAVVVEDFQFLGDGGGKSGGGAPAAHSPARKPVKAGGYGGEQQSFGDDEDPPF